MKYLYAILTLVCMVVMVAVAIVSIDYIDATRDHGANPVIAGVIGLVALLVGLYAAGEMEMAMESRAEL
jgi:hypothetical protein